MNRQLTEPDHGVIRHIHPGGEYVKDDPDYAEMKAQIETLLQEK